MFKKETKTKPVSALQRTELRRDEGSGVKMYEKQNQNLLEYTQASFFNSQINHTHARSDTGTRIKSNRTELVEIHREVGFRSEKDRQMQLF